MHLEQIVERPLEDRRWMRRRLHQIIRIPLFLLGSYLPDDVAHGEGHQHWMMIGQVATSGWRVTWVMWLQASGSGTNKYAIIWLDLDWTILDSS